MLLLHANENVDGCACRRDFFDQGTLILDEVEKPEYEKASRSVHACREALPFSVCLSVRDELPATWPPAEATTLPGGRAGWREDF